MVLGWRVECRVCLMSTKSGKMQAHAIAFQRSPGSAPSATWMLTLVQPAACSRRMAGSTFDVTISLKAAPHDEPLRLLLVLRHFLTSPGSPAHPKEVNKMSPRMFRTPWGRKTLEANAYVPHSGVIHLPPARQIMPQSVPMCLHRVICSLFMCVRACFLSALNTSHSTPHVLFAGPSHYSCTLLFSKN